VKGRVVQLSKKTVRERERGIMWTRKERTHKQYFFGILRIPKKEIYLNKDGYFIYEIVCLRNGWADDPNLPQYTIIAPNELKTDYPAGLGPEDYGHTPL